MKRESEERRRKVKQRMGISRDINTGGSRKREKIFSARGCRVSDGGRGGQRY